MKGYAIRRLALAQTTQNRARRTLQNAMMPLHLARSGRQQFNKDSCPNSRWPRYLRQIDVLGTVLASSDHPHNRAQRQVSGSGGQVVELTPWNLDVWLPAMLVLGLVILGALLAFVAACERV